MWIASGVENIHDEWQHEAYDISEEEIPHQLTRGFKLPVNQLLNRCIMEEFTVIFLLTNKVCKEEV